MPWLDSNREIIHTNVYNIPQRLREIDPNYFVVRNHKTHQFEVHHKDQVGSTLALNIQFDELDDRAVQLARSTQPRYAQNIFREMDRNNEKLENDILTDAMDVAEQKTKEMFRYVAPKGTVDTAPDDAYSTRFI